MKNAIVVLLIILLSSVFLGSVNFSSAGLQTGSLATSYDEPTAAYTKTGNLSVNGLDYWWFSANAGDVLLIGIEADSYYSWTSALYYSNLTLIQTISDYNAHNHMFVATKTDNYLLGLSSGDNNSFNYTIDSSHPMLFATPYKENGHLLNHGVNFWWNLNVNAGDVLLIGIEADSYYSWTSALYYSNLTLIQTISGYDAHPHKFVATKTDNYLLWLGSGYNSFNYTIDSSHPMLFATPYTKTGNLSNNEIEYVWFSNVKKGDVLLIGIEADSYYSWTSALYYSNLTLIKTISDYDAHSHIFVATKTDNYLLVLSSGDNSFNYTIRHNSGSERMPTTLKFSLEPNPAAVGKAVTLQGNLTSNGNPIGSAQVTIKLGASTVGTLVTNSTGWFKASGSVGSAGTYNITVQYAGSEQYLPSANWTILVVRGPTSIYCRIDPNPVNVGGNFTYKGLLVNDYSQPLAGATIQLYKRTLTGPWTYITSVTTNSRGIFTWQSTASTAGTFVFSAYYAGSETYEPNYNYAALIVQ